MNSPDDHFFLSIPTLQKDIQQSKFTASLLFFFSFSSEMCTPGKSEEEHFFSSKELTSYKEWLPSSPSVCFYSFDMHALLYFKEYLWSGVKNLWHSL